MHSTPGRGRAERASSSKLSASAISPKAACFAQQKREQDQSTKSLLASLELARFGQNTVALKEEACRSDAGQIWSSEPRLLWSLSRAFNANKPRFGFFFCDAKPQSLQSNIVASLS